MTPNEKIDDLCARHDVSASFGRRLLPLVRRAMDSHDEKRERLLDLVERSFVEEALRKRTARKAKRDQPLLGERDRELLRTVAGILHPWEPPGWMAQWRRMRRGAGPGTAQE